MNTRTRTDLKLELANIREVDIVVCPPFTALESVSKAIIDDSNIRLGAQNMSENNFGAFTGEICAGHVEGIFRAPRYSGPFRAAPVSKGI